MPRRSTSLLGSGFLSWYIALLACALLFCAPGCHAIVPQISHLPQVHNPFPQLSRVAVAPFFNHSDEATLDGRRFAMAYFAELQAIPGFEVVPLGVVEEAMIRHAIDLSSPGEARRLGEILGVDAVVIGSVTDFSPFYPPRCGMRVEWYTANPGFHEIPAGYGLPWGTPEEEFIPPPLVYEAEMALARAQLESQTPDCIAGCSELPAPPPALPSGPAEVLPVAPDGDQAPEDSHGEETADPFQSEEDQTESLPAPPPAEDAATEADAVTAAYLQEADEPASDAYEELPPVEPDPSNRITIPETTTQTGNAGVIVSDGTLPPGCPDDRCFHGPPPTPVRPPCVVNYGPVMTHTRIFHGTDPQFTEALATYVYFRDDQRYGGWQNYLQRSGDFIRFCCHLHISEMLTARGGAGETQVVCEWPVSR